VAAAGNNGTDNDKRAHYPSNYNLPNVISVAAVDRTDALTSFSNFGAKTVHIAAPVVTFCRRWLGDAFRDASGTSMAAPQVSGVAGLILASEPRISVAKLRERLLGSVDKIPSLDGKVSSGGRLNAAKALGRLDRDFIPKEMASARMPFFSSPLLVYIHLPFAHAAIPKRLTVNLTGQLSPNIS
jgi:subtilisin family serine protease